MSRTIKLADLSPEPTRVELGEHVFNLRHVTRSVQKKFDTVDKAIDALGKGDDSDKLVSLLLDGLDAMLEPVEHSQSAKKVLMDAWKADEISLPSIRKLMDSLQEAASERPT